MKFGEMIDGLIEPFAPNAVARRISARLSLSAVRQYEAAANNRRTQDWRRPSSSADRETWHGLIQLRNGARDLVRNNKYASNAVRQLTAHMIGDGLMPRAIHEDEAVAKAAQDDWDSWAEEPVDGRNDFYQVQKIVGRTMIEGGEALNVWRSDSSGPDAIVQTHEGDYLDMIRTQKLAKGRDVQGVRFDEDGVRTGYWMFEEHPGDIVFGTNYVSNLVDAKYIDHIYEQLRAPQTRGVSWLGAVALTLRDVADIEDAKRLQQKVAACLAVAIVPGEGGSASPLTGEQTPGKNGKPSIETLHPGMIVRLKHGETISTVNPPNTNDGVEFVRQQLAAISAGLVPYHLMTGDVSQANYSSLRGAMLGFWAMLDDWQQQTIIPFACKPAFRRRMRRLSLITGDKRYLKVRAEWAPPQRAFVDPIKDVIGEVAEIRSGLKTLAQSLAERGHNWKPHLEQINRINGEIDRLQLVLETDPRRMTDNGIIQAAVGYLGGGSGAKGANADSVAKEPKI